MRKLIKNIISFSLFSLLSYFTLLILCGQFFPKFSTKNLSYNVGGNGFLFSRLKEADTFKDIDVLIIGSSHAYRGYDVRKFESKGLKTFNLGSSGQTPIQTKILIERYLKRLNPKFIIFDVYPKVFCIDGVESELDLISNVGSIDKNIFRTAIESKNIKVINTLFYGLYRKSSGLDTNFKDKLFIKYDRYVVGGYVETLKKSLPEKGLKKTQYELLPAQIKAFNDVIIILKKKNIPYILVQSPIRKNLYNSITNNIEIDSLFRTHGSYVNFNTISTINNSFFADDSHLNQFGVDVFNADLFNILYKYQIKNNSGKIQTDIFLKIKH